MFAREHFELVARVLRDAPDAGTDGGNIDYVRGAVSERAALREAFADALAATNPRFDRAQFCKAAGPSDNAGCDRCGMYDRAPGSRECVHCLADSADPLTTATRDPREPSEPSPAPTLPREVAGKQEAADAYLARKERERVVAELAAEAVAR